MGCEKIFQYFVNHTQYEFDSYAGNTNRSNRSTNAKPNRRTTTTLSNIGGIYTQIKQPQKALEFYNSSLKISTAIGDRSGAAITLNNIGSVYRVLNQPAQAIAYFEKSVQAILADTQGT